MTIQNTAAPSALAPDVLVRRLRELAGEERDVQVDFLLHLDEFDRRRAFLEAGYGSLWEYCLRALHLREGPAGRRIGAMKALRRFPAVEGALRDGRLCLSTLTVLGPLLTDENLDDLVARAAFRTKAEVEHLVASLHPRAAPRDGVRRLPERLATSESVPASSAPVDSATAIFPLANAAPTSSAERPEIALPVQSAGPALRAREAADASSMARLEPRPLEREPRADAEVRPVSAERWSIRVTIDADLKAELDTLTSLLSHTAGGDLAAVLREAVRCGIEKHGKRKGAVPPARTSASRPVRAGAVRGVGAAGASDVAGGVRADAGFGSGGSPPPAEPGNRAIPAAVRREVWRRDGGCCTWESPDGRRCGSRWKLEIDHVVPVALGGRASAGNLRLLCRSHNFLHAEQVFGREHMARFSSRAPRGPDDAVRTRACGRAVRPPQPSLILG